MVGSDTYISLIVINPSWFMRVWFLVYRYTDNAAKFMAKLVRIFATKINMISFVGV